MSRWFIEHRQTFIRDQLKLFGQIRRADLMRKFDISSPQASADIALFLESNPEVMVYCGSAKSYILSPAQDGGGDV